MTPLQKLIYEFSGGDILTKIHFGTCEACGMKFFDASPAVFRKDLYYHEACLEDNKDPSRLKLLYIAGSFRARNNPFGYNTFEQERNIRKAETCMVRVNDIPGWFGISPHTMTRNLQGAHPDEVYINGTMELMLRCDAVLMLEGWEGSEGAKGELKEAERTGMKVYKSWVEFKAEAMKELVK